MKINFGYEEKYMASRQEAYNKYLHLELKYHKGSWLTDDVVAEFRKRAENLSGTNGQIVGGRRELCLQLMEEYGVLECEAVNILNGYGGRDYVNKYQMIKNQIPLDIKKDRFVEDEEEYEYVYD